MPRTKAIVGEDVFTHESGIHVSGLLKDRGTYEALNPELLGRSHRVVLGKHSGSHAVLEACARLGLYPSDVEVAHIIERIRAYATANKQSPDATQLKAFYLEAAQPLPEVS